MGATGAGDANLVAPTPGTEDVYMETGQKLDNIQETMTELRVSIAQLSGDVRASLARHDRQDVVTADVERRLRALERRSYAVPSVGAVLGLSGFALALWNSFH